MTDSPELLPDCPCCGSIDLLKVPDVQPAAIYIYIYQCRSCLCHWHQDRRGEPPRITVEMAKDIARWLESGPAEPFIEKWIAALRSIAAQSPGQGGAEVPDGLEDLLDELIEKAIDAGCRTDPNVDLRSIRQKIIAIYNDPEKTEAQPVAQRATYWMVECIAGGLPLWYTGEFVERKMLRSEKEAHWADFSSDPNRGVRFPTQLGGEQMIEILSSLTPKVIFGNGCYKVTEHEWPNVAPPQPVALSEEEERAAFDEWWTKEGINDFYCNTYAHKAWIARARLGKERS